jgi:hypothetical protein
MGRSRDVAGKKRYLRLADADRIAVEISARPEKLSAPTQILQQEILFSQP